MIKFNIIIVSNLGIDGDALEVNTYRCLSKNLKFLLNI